MNRIERVPKIWRQAYLLICLWYALNFIISIFFEWTFVTPKGYVIWHGLILYEALCLFIALIFLWSRFLFKRSYTLQLTGHMIGIVLFFLINATLSYYFTDYLEGYIYFVHWQEYMIGLMSWDALRFYDQYIITVGVFYVISYFMGLQKREQEKTDLQLKNKEMQIALLRSQINPHFLFNTLNSISTLMYSSKDEARKVITQLSDVFRYALDSHSADRVRVAKEIDFIENYMRIQQVRFGDRLKFSKAIDPACLDVLIPPMILQPLVENAVKYGIAPKEDGGTVYLSVKMLGNIIYFEVSDNGLGSKAKKIMDGTSSGVGMVNTDLRLKSYFGFDSRLNVKSSELGYTVSFSIPSEVAGRAGIAEEESIIQ